MVGGSPGGPVAIDKVQVAQPEVKLPSVTEGDVLNKQVAFTAKELVDESDLYRQSETSSPLYVNRSDILSLLHKKLGVQSISDHHSNWFAWSLEGTQTARYVLDHLSEMIGTSEANELAALLRSPSDPKSDPMQGWDGSCLYMRERYPYELDSIEVPNSLIRQLRTNLAGNRYLGFEDVASIAALADGQAAALTRQPNWDRLIKVRGTDYSDKEGSNVSNYLHPVVRLYSHLSDPQRRAFVSSGLQMKDLTIEQRDLVARCLGKLPSDAQQNKQPNRRVGVWWKNTRIDKPQSDAATPIAIRLRRQQGQEYLVRISTPDGNWTGSDVTASSVGDARDKLLSLYPDLPKRPHFFGMDMGYAMVFVYADGSTKDIPVTLYQPAASGG
jgi:hypothetical protein